MVPIDEDLRECLVLKNALRRVFGGREGVSGKVEEGLRGGKKGSRRC